jgi:outer membrane protein assembly factor BamB
MNATRVSKSAARKHGSLLMAILLVLLGFQLMKAGESASKIYVLSDLRGTRVTTFTVDGRPTTPVIGLGGSICAGLAVDADGKIYVANHSNRNGILIFNPDGTPGNHIGLPAAPVGVAVSQGTIYVLEAPSISNAIVKSFHADHSPTPLNIMTGMVSAGGIAVDRFGKIYVAAQSNVMKTFDPNGQPATPVITAGLNSPRAIAVSPAGSIYMASVYGVGRYLPSGARAEPNFVTGNPFGGVLSPTAVAVDASGKVYIGYYSLDRDNGLVAVFTPDGKLINRFLVPGGVEAIAVH